MPLAESISYSLGGRRSGKGYRIRSVCHGGDGKNLYIEDSQDGKLIATCFSHGCEYKSIMSTLEDMGLKPKPDLSSTQRKVFVQKKSRRQLMESLFFESHILLQYLNDRAGDLARSGDSNYLKLHPEFQKLPDEPFDRELKAALRTKTIIEQLYGI
jgi:hypothetical protein